MVGSVALAAATSLAAAEPVAIAEPLTVAEPAGAPAEPGAVVEPVARRWPQLPLGRQISFSEQLTDQLTLLGNTLGHHLDLLSADMLQLTFDGRRRRAHVRVGAGASSGFGLWIDGVVQFDAANARVHASVDLSYRSHLLHLDLPYFEMQPTEYRGEYGVVLVLPLFVWGF
jgi:hypothetical protein